MSKGKKMDANYVSVTEISGDEVSREQIERLCNRYYWAGHFCTDKDTLEVACGTGQGLGYLDKIARTFEAGDYSDKIIALAREHYGDRIRINQFDAQDMPYADQSKDVIILFEAIYYIPKTERFVKECTRILRPGGILLIATANKDLYDFNPSPYSHKYFGVVELNELFSFFGFSVDFFGGSPIKEASVRQKILRPVKRIAVNLNLIPKTMSGKKYLKRLIFGKLIKMPAELNENTSKYIPPKIISKAVSDTVHQVIFCAATLLE